ncbi:hypothetical protein CBS147353_10531 [Aspergillus niger]|nr:hypothetical protein CBS147353_10531 [Aspergillus niger]
MSECSSLYFTDANAAAVTHFLKLQRHNGELNFKVHLARPSAALACGLTRNKPVQFYGLPDVGFPDAVSLHHALDDELVQPPFGDPLPMISNAEASSKSLSKEISFTMDLEENGLTPLEMPDGSTRFTTNWPPLDPEGGFTIRAPPTARRSEPNSDSNHQMAQDTGGYLFVRNAFISIPTVTGLSSTAV